jgi:hypothetical protein
MRNNQLPTPDQSSLFQQPAELSWTALRYVAGELDPAEGEQFEARLGADQSARDAVTEAVRLSAVASGLPVPSPDPLVRSATLEKLNPTWASRFFPRRPYRGHPLAWAAIGGGVTVAVVATILPYLATVPAVAPASPTPEASDAVESPTAYPVQIAESSIPQLGHPLANSKLNPMRYEEHSPLSGRLSPQAPPAVVPAISAPVSIPMPMPSGPRAEVPVDQEVNQPMAPTDGSTKKG